MEELIEENKPTKIHVEEDKLTEVDKMIHRSVERYRTANQERNLLRLRGR